MCNVWPNACVDFQHCTRQWCCTFIFRFVSLSSLIYTYVYVMIICDSSLPRITREEAVRMKNMHWLEIINWINRRIVSDRNRSRDSRGREDREMMSAIEQEWWINTDRSSWNIGHAGRPHKSDMIFMVLFCSAFVYFLWLSEPQIVHSYQMQFSTIFRASIHGR